MLSAEIIAIGSELLAADRTDTNSLWQSKRPSKRVVNDGDTARDLGGSLSNRELGEAVRKRLS